jgi:5-methylcytosine-specific restriction protein A
MTTGPRKRRAKVPYGKPNVPTTSGRSISVSKQVDAELSDAEWRALRETIRKRAGYRCEWIEADGRRCRASHPATRLFVDHKIERRDNGDNSPENLWCLCGLHHARKTVDEQKRRMRGQDNFKWW